MLHAQDVITTKAGARLNVKIISEDSLKVDFTWKPNGLRVTSYIEKSDVALIEYGSGNVVKPNKASNADVSQYAPDQISMDELPGTHRTTFGFGLGRDYGGLGINATGYINHNFGVFGGVGYALAGIGFNGGLKIKLASKQSKSHVIPYLTGMYGYNSGVVFTNAPERNKLFYGPTFGGGIDIYTKHYRGIFVLGVLIPVVSDEADAYDVPKVGASVGYRFAVQ